MEVDGEAKEATDTLQQELQAAEEEQEQQDGQAPSADGTEHNSQLDNPSQGMVQLAVQWILCRHDQGCVCVVSSRSA